MVGLQLTASRRAGVEVELGYPPVIELTRSRAVGDGGQVLASLSPRALAARALLQPIARRMEKAAFEPRPAQELALGRVLRECAGAEVGRRLGLAGVRSLDDLKRIRPTGFEDYRDDAERVYREGARAGARFGRSPPVALALSSGTTGAPKRWPLTRAALAAWRRATLALQACVLDDAGEWAQLTGGKQILLANAGDVELAPCGLPCGYASGIVLQRLPRLMRSRFLPSPEVLREPSWERKLTRLLDEARGGDVRIVGGFPAALTRFTERALESYRVRSLAEIWPNLRALFFGGASLSTAARERFTIAWRGEAGGRLAFWENYSSIEAMFGHSFRRDWPGLVFSPFESVFLFSESAAAERLLRLDELEAGMRVHLFLTSQAGLVQYRMDDLIAITSRRPLTFRFVSRAFDQVSLAGEKISLVDADEAFSIAARATGASPGDWALWLEEGNPARVVWALPAPADPAIAEALDRALRERNVNYARFRASGFFGPPRIEPVEAGTFRDYRARHLHEGTFKEKRLFPDRAAFERELSR